MLFSFKNYWLHPIKIMLHALDFFISILKKSHKKTKLYFHTLNFIFANVDKTVFCFLEKFQEVSVATWSAHFPYTKPLVRIVSLYFKIKPSLWSGEGPEPLILLIRNITIKHFKNISRKIRSSHCSYIDVTFLQ